MYINLDQNTFKTDDNYYVIFLYLNLDQCIVVVELTLQSNVDLPIKDSKDSSDNNLSIFFVTDKRSPTQYGSMVSITNTK